MTKECEKAFKEFVNRFGATRVNSNARTSEKTWCKTRFIGCWEYRQKEISQLTDELKEKDRVIAIMREALEKIKGKES